MLPLAHIPTPSQALHNFTAEISGVCCSRCTWDVHCVLVYLLPKALWFPCQPVPNLLGFLDLCVLQIPRCQNKPTSLVLLVWHPCPFLHCQAWPFLGKECANRNWNTVRCDQHSMSQVICPPCWIFSPFVNRTMCQITSQWKLLNEELWFF